MSKWIKCSKRLPTKDDADCDDSVWWSRFGRVAY